MGIALITFAGAIGATSLICLISARCFRLGHPAKLALLFGGVIVGVPLAAALLPLLCAATMHCGITKNGDQVTLGGLNLPASTHNVLWKSDNFGSYATFEITETEFLAWARESGHQATTPPPTIWRYSGAALYFASEPSRNGAGYEVAWYAGLNRVEYRYASY